ncbi:hypothetical protein ACR9YC_02130 [Parasphingorhabdus sp. DH2-15]|uniref:hypothetical protein n=1 Tax=Parasphingorhabdus sp. DH2-15 TaxID=3444112 RepID=UPI003F686443
MAGSGKSAESYYTAAQKVPTSFLSDIFANPDTELTISAAAEARNNEQLGQASGSVDGRIAIGVAQANRRRGERDEKAKAKARANDNVLAAILDDIARMESDLANQYGANFAGDLLADLCAKGLIEDDEYTRIMAIEGDTERRRAIALRIQEGLNNGTIKPDDLKGHPWAKDWLKEHGKATAEMTRQAARHERGEISASAINRDAKDEVKYSVVERTPDQQSEAEVATVQADQSKDTAADDETALTNNVDLSAMFKPL